ncbi:glycosyltransferase family 2 protein [Nocardiopsis sp. CC223A]|uniref:glycosyltransferase family 2 protein n=1 Tax=Nocardiopsis sp. CC223A TaxID=3044051 RepID=UPI00278C7D5E|nr:glycosyltransferase family 2 protein [Nocardiopsis sp. CC223A]
MTALSVIIPAKDVAPYIGDTLASLVRNDRPDFEYIVIDDGSSDDTPNIVDDFRKRLPNLRMLRNPAPTGLSAARNQGVADSTGRYITYLDGDDWLAPGYLALALETTERLGVDFSKTDQVQVFGRRRVFKPAPEGRVNQALDPRSGILPANGESMVDYPNACTGIYSRALVDQGLMRFDPALRTCEDRPWAWGLHLKAASYARVPVIGVFYRRQVTGSLTQIGDERQLHFLDACDRIMAMAAADPESDRFLPKALRTYCALMLFQIDKRDRLPRHLQQELVTRCTEALRAFPAEHLERLFIEIDRKRSKRLIRLKDGDYKDLKL